MRLVSTVLAVVACLCCAVAAGTEYNPLARPPPSIGPEASRLIVGFKTTPANAVTHTITSRLKARVMKITQAQTSPADVVSLTRRAGLAMAASRQITPSMHVIFLPNTVYGSKVASLLARLRADPAVKFADVDTVRYPLTLPNDPLFVPTAGASGQWYMNTPSATPVTVEGVQTTDLSATDAVSAWGITTGSSGIVIADVDTGVRFDHPDLLRAGLGGGGRLLPGYDFVGEDYNSSGVALGTYLEANDGDGWDPDPSDPGDWVSSSDTQNSLFKDCTVENSSWHGTRVVGIFGAITDNELGLAGMSWGAWVLPVRALGKCGGYDSDIIAGIEWAAGMPVTGAGVTVPDNPYPADIINLSLGGGTTCPSDYQDALTTVTGLGVLVVASAGNSTTSVTTTSSVEAPANCSASVSGIIAVAGLRNVGTKVGYSSLGPEVGISAPAGNCINSSGDCLRSIDTTTNLGTTTPGANSYTNETNSNLGTSFSAPIVAGIASLMRSVNYNLTPAQLVARVESSAAAFPANTGNLAVCPSLDASTDECSCPPSGQCGSGMANALSAVQAAEQPIAAVSLPATITAGSAATFDAGGSAAACNRTIVSYAWKATGGVSIASGANAAQASILPGSGTVTLTVTDSAGATDTATIAVTATSATSTAPTTAGNSACPTALSTTPSAPTVTQSFSPSSVIETIASTLTLTFTNANAFDLTEVGFTDTVPAALAIASSPAPSTTCTFTNYSLTVASGTVTLTGGDIPPKSSCTLTLSVSSTTAGAFTNTVAAGALTTGPAGGNATASTAALTVTAPNPATVSASFAPASVVQNGTSTLTLSLNNSNAIALTGVAVANSLPGSATVSTATAPTTSCGGSLTSTTSSVSLTGGTIPASGACTIVVTVTSSTVGTYTDTIAAGALTTTPAAATNKTTATATLTVTAAGGGGGGALNWLDLLVAGGMLAGARLRRAADCASAPSIKLPDQYQEDGHGHQRHRSQQYVMSPACNQIQHDQFLQQWCINSHSAHHCVPARSPYCGERPQKSI
jgi:serine protease